MNKEWARFNMLSRKQNELYHQLALRAGISDSQFWILYALCEGGGCLCQNGFCEKWCTSKQTVNAAVAGLQKADMITLDFVQGSRKQKEMRLTETGKEFAIKYIYPVMEAECAAIMTLPQQQRTWFMDTMEQLLETLEKKCL